nr:tetratricopeptide repeat protein [Anaerolineales bacterium]
LDDLSHLDLTPLEAPEPELTYIFKHIITQEVAYETLLFSQRRQLHGAVARWYEGRFGFSPERPAGDGEALAILPLLVFHWRNAEDHARERVYAAQAGRWSAAQFANTEAIGYLTRAFELTPETDLDERYALLLVREGVNDLRGERGAQADDLGRLAALADGLADDRRRAEVNVRRANYAEVTSDYPAALAAVRAAVEQAAGSGDAAREAEAQIAWGKVLIRQGEFAEAGAPLQRGLALARAQYDHAAEARSLYHLGLLELWQNHHAAAAEQARAAASRFQVLGHRQGEADALGLLGIIYQELGDSQAARDEFQAVLTVFRTTGDRRGETIALSNLGTVYCDLGDFAAARAYHEQALALRRMIADRWGEAVSQVNLALTYHNLTDHAAARAAAEQALLIQREIGDRRGLGYSLTYLGHALAGLGEWAAAAQAYSEARQIREELGQTGLSQDDRAGLARVALARQAPAQARAETDAILAWIDEHGLAGIEYPLQVLYTCYTVLAAGPDAAAEARARAVLDQAYTTLQTQANAIRDPVLRRTFLENVAVHRAIQAAWAARPAGPA